MPAWLNAPDDSAAARRSYTECMDDIANIRKSYEQAELDESAASIDPFKQFGDWLQQAIDAGVPEPNAMTLATVAPDGRPSTRVVLIKGFDLHGFVWYTNYQSRKGCELAANPMAALQFHWVELERVVRIEGRVEMVSAEESDRYFASRPFDSRIGALASPQSQVIASREVLAERFSLSQQAWAAGRDIDTRAGTRHDTQRETQGGTSGPPRPPHWGGYRLVPDTFEFWQGRKSRLHDRLRYQLKAGHWQRDRLAP